MTTSTAAQRVPPLHLVPLAAPMPAVRPAPPVTPIAADAAMGRLFEQAARVAVSDLPVLVQGESGVGKEVVVRWLHASSSRARGPFLAENCSAIPETLAESLLFGHVRGAFTGADRDRDGLFVQADGGTLFLDEIGDMPSALQARLLRVLEERRVRPVGGHQSVPIDVRIVCATNSDLTALVREGRFRADLYYRLAGATLRIPALRERPDDVEVLALHVLGELNASNGTRRRFAGGLVDRMRSHAWPGNVRELRNRVAALYHLTDGEVIDGQLPDTDGREAHAGGGTRLVTRVAPLREIEGAAIRLALQATKGDRREAARRLGISRSTLYVRIRDLGL